MRVLALFLRFSGLVLIAVAIALPVAVLQYDLSWWARASMGIATGYLFPEGIKMLCRHYDY